jgi:hypothetical protein
MRHRPPNARGLQAALQVMTGRLAGACSAGNTTHGIRHSIVMHAKGRMHPGEGGGVLNQEQSRHIGKRNSSLG